jgi:dolichyl-phosphate beta-glucosyltransferase
MDLSIVIPAYNEERRIAGTLQAILDYMARQSYASEILVVDDGSTDATVDAVAPFSLRKPSVRLLKNKRNRGKGFSVRKGFLRARGRYLMFSDADLSTPIDEVQKLIARLRRGWDVAIGSRALPESRIEARQLPHRENMGRLFNVLVQTLVICGIRDTQCGFKCFRRDAAVEICRRMACERFAFDVEMLYLARFLGYRVAEVPVVWRNSPETKVNALRDSASMFADLMRIRWNRRCGRYDVRKSTAGSARATVSQGFVFPDRQERMIDR